ncbi:hypothetical protein CC117_23890 [Parafrankia colletiae]|uniref:Uncharacterized protein n=1 Tax=Parafrankia colletiae TaxID=573497 RepID=A0A1S1QHD6_9ACTN|nr:hypothetical protein [Parafrankia colletiae]MCK9902876.1 hypothetical protein [Frankia sp. Cpl3]OHV33077.1 hypothetical protein CC117_23890 [Parafrankia colletiae]
MAVTVLAALLCVGTATAARPGDPLYGGMRAAGDAALSAAVHGTVPVPRIDRGARLASWFASWNGPDEVGPAAALALFLLRAVFVGRRSAHPSARLRGPIDDCGARAPPLHSHA